MPGRSGWLAHGMIRLQPARRPMRFQGRDPRDPDPGRFSLVYIFHTRMRERSGNGIGQPVGAMSGDQLSSSMGLPEDMTLSLSVTTAAVVVIVTGSPAALVVTIRRRMAGGRDMRSSRSR